MKRAGLILVLILGAAGIASPHVARAQQAPAPAPPESEAAADAIFREATAAFTRGEFRVAAEKFEEAHRRLPRGATLYNAATAWESAGAPERAADTFLASVEEGDLDAAQASRAFARVAELQKRVGRIEVHGPASARVWVAHAAALHPPTRIHVQPGRHELRFTLEQDGRTVTGTQTVIVTKAATTIVELEAPPPPLTATVPRAAIAEDTQPVPAPAARGRWLLPASVVSAGVSLAAVGAGSMLGLAGLRARNDYEESGFIDPGQRDRAITYRTAANVAWGTAAVTAALAVAFFVLAPARSSSTKAASAKSN